MNKYNFFIKIDDEELNAIFMRLAKAQMEIQECYFQLQRMNVVVFKKRKRPAKRRRGKKSIRDYN